MLKRRYLFTALIIVAVVAAVASYEAGRILTLQDRITTTTTVTTISFSTLPPTTVTETATKTTTATSTVTSTTTTNFDTGDISTILGNGSVITMRRMSNDSLLFTLSIDKQTYHYGETMHIRGTVTNLTPNPMNNFFITEFQIYVYNSTGGEAWTSPIGIYDGLDNLRPSFDRQLSIKPHETVEIDYATETWNFTGIHIVKVCYQGNCGVAPEYNGVLAPPGTYTIQWQPSYTTDYARINGCCNGGFNQPITINFKIEK
ncbi:MAG: hypothetical protein M1503_03075 [Thaumarchaeota archaeon]|nr:hypothetical protein [Nitrososphaerota archaeon]MCL5317234.1 hypothetical protein [Nitrososphaerota archaeon]